MKKYKRLIIDLGYVVPAGDDEMIQRAKECFYEDIMNMYKYDEIFDAIDIVDAPGAKEADIPEFLLEREDEDLEEPRWPNPQKSLA
jgi:hypothetical protein